MQRLCLLLSLFATAAVVLPVAAHAVDIEDLDSDGKKKKSKKERVVLDKDEIIREIERGWYFKAGAGVADYFLTYARTIEVGSAVFLATGFDFVDEPNRSMSVEFKFQQGIHNGMPFDVQPQVVSPGSFIQGDTRTFAFTAAYRFAAYPSRRVGVGVQAGGGIMFAPLLIDKNAYNQTVVPLWGGDPGVHSRPHFPVFAGPTLEYYTKLSHFSIGLDTDVTYAIGFDLGFNALGYMKYTF
jgi:hypothetical protein